MSWARAVLHRKELNQKYLCQRIYSYILKRADEYLLANFDNIRLY